MGTTDAGIGPAARMSPAAEKIGPHSAPGIGTVGEPGAIENVWAAAGRAQASAARRNETTNE
jgi:hypothetical protein